MLKNTILLLIFFNIGIKAFGQNEGKPIVIITQDGEVDDRSSFLRFLLYTPDIDLRGIIATNSKWQKNGHGLKWIDEAYGKYAEVLDNLLLHHPNYPSVEFLKSITVLGNENPAYLTGAPPYADSEGSELIIKELLALGDNQIHLNCWGGVNTVAQALWKFRADFPKEYEKKAGYIRVIAVEFQDEAGDWLVKNMPEIRVLRNNAFHMTWNYHSIEKPLPHNPYPNLMSEKWLSENVKTDHGPLGAWYPQNNISEGDTPAYLNFIDNGLKAYENYSWGGWGGRYHSIDGNYWMNAPDDQNLQKTLWRWIPDVQNDFAARMDWCFMNYEEANHAPEIVEVIGAEVVKPGQKVELKASGSDPDGDNLYYYWWHYPDPSGMAYQIKINLETAAEASFTVPERSGEAIHIILEVRDDGTPSLKRYQRLVFEVEK